MKIVLFMTLIAASVYANAESYFLTEQADGSYVSQKVESTPLNTLEVYCRQGDHVITGGCEGIGFNKTLPITTSTPLINDNSTVYGWSCAWQPQKNHGSTQYTLRATVYCQKK